MRIQRKWFENFFGDYKINKRVLKIQRTDYRLNRFCEKSPK